MLIELGYEGDGQQLWLWFAEEDGVDAGVCGAGVGAGSAVDGVGYAVVCGDRVVTSKPDYQILSETAIDDVVTGLVDVAIAEDLVVSITCLLYTSDAADE